MFKLLSSLIKLKDFTQLKHSILLKNDTSGTSVTDLDKIIIDSFDNELLNLSLPKNTLGPNHNVTLFIYETPISKDDLEKIKNKNYKTSFEIIGKAIELINENDKQYAKIELTQYDKHKWKNICSKYDQTQSNIMDLIEQEESDDV
jgi:hypothetical protein